MEPQPVMLDLRPAIAQTSASLALAQLAAERARDPALPSHAKLPPITERTRLLLLSAIFGGIEAELASALPDLVARLGVLTLLAVVVISWPRA